MATVKVTNDLSAEGEVDDRPVMQVNNAANCEQSMSMLVVWKQIFRPSSFVFWCSTGYQCVEGQFSPVLPRLGWLAAYLCLVF